MEGRRERGRSPYGVSTGARGQPLRVMEAAPERDRTRDRNKEARAREKEQSGSPGSGHSRRRAPRSKKRGKRRMRGRRCWNCLQRDHVLGRCPQPLTQKICFRCGRQGRTVGECPRCAHAWRALGPYVPGVGNVPRDIRLPRGIAGRKITASEGTSEDAGASREISGSPS